MANISSLTFYWGILVLIVGVLDTIINRNQNDRAAKWAAYYVGMEVLLRMTGGNVFWEAGKYGTIILLAVGLLCEKSKRPWPRQYLLYFLLLIPSLVVIDFPSFDSARQEISFNLSGPFLLALSAVYFYDRKMSGDRIADIFRSTLLPLLSMVIYLAIATPSIQDIEYGSQSNFQASGGFGPNQVSTVVGLAIFLIMVGIFFKIYLINSALVDIAFLIFFSLRGLATFSRGGMIGAAVGIMILIGYTAIVTKRSSVFATIFSFLLFAGGTGIIVWNYVNEQTKGRLEYRYTGKNFATGETGEITSGRAEIMMNELEFFFQNPVFGIGPGMGTIMVTHAGILAHSHSEYTRLLAEHGIFGIISLLVLLFAPVFWILKLPKTFRPFPIAIFVFVLFTLSHSAMRLAVPGFFYGLCLIQPLFVQPKASHKPTNA